MSEARKANVEPKQPAAPWRARAVAQLAACLVAQDRKPELAPLLDRHSDPECGAHVRFYLALLYAQEAKFTEAVEHLRPMLAANATDPRLRHLAFRIFLRFAQFKLKASEWTAASQALGDAVRFCPQEPRALRELENLRGALPLAHVHAGNRDAAAKVWEDDLKKNAEDSQALHHLALMFYWWAMQLEAGEGQPPAVAQELPADPAFIRRNYAFRDGQFVESEAGEKQESGVAHPADLAWEAAIGYWSLLASHNAFWSHWRKAQQEASGGALHDTDVESLKEKILNDRLIKTIQDFASHYSEQGRDADVGRHERYLTALGVEQKTAELWPIAMTLVADSGDSMLSRAAENPLLRLPAGFCFFRRIGLLPDVTQIIEALANRHADNPLLPQLQIYFSPFGFGQIAVLIEERKKAETALEWLQRLPEEFHERPEVVYLRAQALLEKGRQASVKQNLSAALVVWKQGWEILQQTIRKGALTSAFKELLQSTREAVAEAVFQACEKESGKLKQAEKFDEAIAVLREGLDVTHRKEMKDLLCILYCDRGDRLLNDKKFLEARKDFEAAIGVDAENARAKRSLGQTYMIEGLDIGAKDLSRALDIMEKGMKYVGEDPQAAELMAQACNARAVELLNNVSASTPISKFDESIKLLRRAIKLMNPKLKDSVLDTMVNEESVDAVEEAIKDLKDDTYKKALQNLALAGRFRRQKRAGDLNSEAVSILNRLNAYSSRYEVDRAIQMLEEAASIINPRLKQLMFMVEHMDESQIRNIGGSGGTILANLATAYKIRKQLRGF